jgi:uncharacterized membrane protein
MHLLHFLKLRAVAIVAWRLPCSAAFAITATFLFGAGPAVADFKLCNATSSRLGVAIGYQDQKGWATEGWWNIPAQACETLLKQMPSRYIYVHAVDYDRAGEWGGANFMCTSDRSFVIRDVKDCPKRGYKRAGFFEVDTGEAKDWTVRLTDPDESGAKPK